MTRPTWSEARDAIACRGCKAAPGANCRSLLDKPLNACHPARMDDAAAVLDFLDLETP
ncbi:hypothetical protein [Nocardioides sp. NPDC006273]|uniref:zinc finger domain-containing protein n=1 Tax=Nocardioides sp. NPDC006273 TaxID=3155598 RepID=UPI00339F1BF3